MTERTFAWLMGWATIGVLALFTVAAVSNAIDGNWLDATTFAILCLYALSERSRRVALYRAGYFRARSEVIDIATETQLRGLRPGDFWHVWGALGVERADNPHWPAHKWTPIPRKSDDAAI